MRNYFVDAYTKNKPSTFMDAHIRMLEMYVPYFKDGKLNYREKSFEPQKSLKSHIFICNGK
jgi:hypothetical protein